MTDKRPKGIALITGASSGIGAIYADRIAWRGYDLLLIARNLRRLNENAGKLRQETGVEVETLQADLTAPSDLLRVEERLRSDHGIVVLINNAGVAMTGELGSSNPDQLEAMIRVNAIALDRCRASGVCCAKTGHHY